MPTKPLKPDLPKANALRWEIGSALIIKSVLLIGLWFLVFRWLDKPASQPDIAEHFAPPAPEILKSTTFSQPHQEVRHVR